MNYQNRLDARVVELHDRECSERACTPDTMGKWREIARNEAILRDGMALDNIEILLSGNEWSADTLDAIATEVKATGRQVHEVGEL